MRPARAELLGHAPLRCCLPRPRGAEDSQFAPRCRYEKGLYFPQHGDGGADKVGRSTGAGTTVNVGWNTKGYSRPGDAEYFAVWREVRGRPSDLLQQ